MDLELLEAKTQNRKDYEYLINNKKINKRVSDLRQSQLEERLKRDEENANRILRVQEENNKIQTEFFNKIQAKHDKTQKQVLAIPKIKYRARDPFTYFNPVPVAEDNEYKREEYQSKIAERMHTLSLNKQNHLNEIRNKYEQINSDALEKHKNYMRNSLGHFHIKLRDKIDLQGAKDLQNLNKAVNLRSQRINEFTSRLNERAMEVQMRNHSFFNDKEDAILSITKDLRDGKFIYANYPNTTKANKKFSSRLAELTQAHMERNCKYYMEMKTSHNEILNKQFNKFKNANISEKNIIKFQKQSLLETINNQEKLDQKMEDFHRQIEAVKSNSVLKKDPNEIN